MVEPLSPDDVGFATTKALVAYLRSEADSADEKAKRLREQALALSQRFGITEEMQTQYEMDPEELPPVDENGVPKYKGKKRGRKPKPRKRQQNPNRRKRQHTAYTLFVKETYPGIKAQNPHLPSKDLISIVAKQWNEGLTPEEKREWKIRAKATHEETTEALENDTDATSGHDHLHAVSMNVGGEEEATAAADALYQQTVAHMEEEEDDDDDSEAASDEEDDNEKEEEDDDEDEEESEEIDDEEEGDDVDTSPPPKRRRGRPKKAG